MENIYKLEHIDIEITPKCNLTCIHCSAQAGERNVKEDELSEEEIKKILLNAKELGLKKVGITGGEPLCDIKKLENIVKFCVNELKVSLHTHTNGTLITEELCKEGGILSYFDSISVTFLGATPQIHDYVTQKRGSFEKAFKGASILSKSGLPLTCYFIPFRGMSSEFGKLLMSLNNIGVKRIRVMALAPSGRARQDYERIVPSSEEFKKFENEILEIGEKLNMTIEAGYCTRLSLNKLKVLKGHESCLSAINRVHINYKGDVFPCTAASGVKELRLGCLRKNGYNIKEIWENSKIANKIRLLRAGKLECRLCGSPPKCKTGCIVKTIGTMQIDYLQKCPLLN